MKVQQRFFSDDSYWNQPLEANPAIHENNERFIELLITRCKNRFWLNLGEYSIPVYKATKEAPLVKVEQRTEWDGGTGTNFRMHKDFINPLPLPSGVLPAPGSDGHIVLVDYEQDMVWDMWGARYRDDGVLETCSGINYSMSGSGCFPLDAFDAKPGDSIHYHGPCRAAGTPLIAGLIMQHEIENGAIEHKIACATEINMLQRCVYPPALWTDGQKPEGLAEGMIIQLDPELNLDRFHLSHGAMVVARALQKYGAVNVDGAGGATLYGEWGDASNGNSWQGILDSDALCAIEMMHYRVLQTAEVLEQGDPQWYGKKH